MSGRYSSLAVRWLSVALAAARACSPSGGSRLGVSLVWVWRLGVGEPLLARAPRRLRSCRRCATSRRCGERAEGGPRTSAGSTRSDGGLALRQRSACRVLAQLGQRTLASSEAAIVGAQATLQVVERLSGLDISGRTPPLAHRREAGAIRPAPTAFAGSDGRAPAFAPPPGRIRPFAPRARGIAGRARRGSARPWPAGEVSRRAARRGEIGRSAVRARAEGVVASTGSPPTRSSACSL